MHGEGGEIVTEATVHYFEFAAFVKHLEHTIMESRGLPFDVVDRPARRIGRDQVTQPAMLNRAGMNRGSRSGQGC